MIMPVAIWAFITLFMRDLNEGLDISSLALYLTCVLTANLIQAFIVLPGLLKLKKISPWRMAKGMYPALSVAFFTKSSAAALPMAIRCAEENLGISKRVANFTLPLCTTINMNACAFYFNYRPFCFDEPGRFLYISRNGNMDCFIDNCCNW